MNYTFDLSVDEAIKVGKLWWGRYFFTPTIVDLHLDGIKYSSRREVTRENPHRKTVQMNWWSRFDGTDFYVLNEPSPGVWHTWPSMEGELLTELFVTEVIAVSSISKNPLSASQFQRDIQQPGLVVLDVAKTEKG